MTFLLFVGGLLLKKGKKVAEQGPDFGFERQAIKRYGALVAGVDEAGRGPWAGPVVAAAVILNQAALPEGVNDSKKLAETKREYLFEEISRTAVVGVGIADVARIDQDNILNATLWAMAEAVRQLPEQPHSLLVDGNKVPDVPMPAEAVVKGDGRSLSIAAASIVAKVTRDRIMGVLDLDFPGFQWARNKGYGTKAHQEALQKFGVTEHHRRSFKPIGRLID